MTHYRNLSVGSIALVGLQCVAYAQDKSQGSFSRAIELVESGDRLGAKQELDQIPEAELIEACLAFVQNNPTLNENLRQYCFEVLATRRAAETEEGYRLFIDGLLDPSVRRWSVAGLAYVPTERRRETVGHFVRVSTLMNPADSKNVILQALGILKRWGEAGEAALPQVEQIFHNPQHLDRDRSLAAHAMLAIGSAERAVDHFERENVRLCLGAIGEFGAQTNGAFNTGEETRSRIRRLVCNSLQSADGDVHALAFEALLPAYSHDFVVEDGQGEWLANPELVRVLNEFVANESDVHTRRRAQAVLDSMDQRVKHAIRMRKERAGAGTLPPNDT